MYNYVAAWLFMIGTPERARKLRARLDGLKSPPLDPMFGPEPKQCPLTVLYGAQGSRDAYADPKLRPALDAWDTGYVSVADLHRWCLEIERGNYNLYNGLKPASKHAPSRASRASAAGPSR